MNKGFTLVELLGVIVILGLIMVLVLPKVTGYVRSSTTKTDKLTEDLIYDASNLYLNNNKNIYDTVNGSVYCISLKTLVKENYLKDPITFADGQDITNTKSIQATFNNKYSLKLVDSNECKEVVSLAPELFDGLVPVVYNNSNWQIADPSSNWYNYSNQQWANAVILKDDVNKNIGDIVTVDGNNPDVIAMFVWIPRYSYTIKGTYGKGGVDLANPGEIDIKFVSRGTKEKGSANYIGENPNNWLTHPAFTFGGKELRGIWVGKFETTGTTSNPTVLPNKQPISNDWLSHYVSASQVLNNYISGDSHVMKNSEWGAVAYLSQSKYGKYGNVIYGSVNKEIYQNRYLSTGKSSGKPGSSTDITECNYDDVANRSNNTGECGGGASTTGNIYGVYDMSGGSIEIVFAGFTLLDNEFDPNALYNEGFYGGVISGGIVLDGDPLPDREYYDIYKKTSLNAACNNYICYGHALSEVSGWYSDNILNYDDDQLWLYRGGSSNDEIESGIFNTSLKATGNISFRVVIS